MKSRWNRAWWLLLLAPLAFGLGRLRIDTEVLDLLPAEEPAVQGLKIYQQHFANARELIITLRGPDADKAERLAGVLATRLRAETNLVAGVSWQPPWMENPAQAAEIAGYLWFNQPPPVFGELTNRLSAGRLPAVLGETREVLATSLSPMDIAVRSFDPYDLMNVPALKNFSGMSAEQGQGMFASADGTLRVLYVAARPDLAAYPANSAWLQSLQKTVAALRANQADWAGVVVRYTGRPAFVTETAASMQHDLSGSVTGTAMIIAVLFWLMHRRWLPMLWLLALLALILIATVALGGLILGTISVVSLGFAAVLLGLAVDYAVVHYQEALAHPQLSVPEIRRAICPQHSLGGHHHHQRVSGAEFRRAAGPGATRHAGGHRRGAGGVGDGDGLSAAAVSGAMESRAANQPRQPWWTYFMPPRENDSPPPAASRSAYSRAPRLWSPSFWFLRRAGVVVPPAQAGRTGQRASNPAQPRRRRRWRKSPRAMGIPQDPLWVIVSGSDEAGSLSASVPGGGAVAAGGFKPNHQRLFAADGDVAAPGISGGQPRHGRGAGRAGPCCARPRCGQALKPTPCS